MKAVNMLDVGSSFEQPMNRNLVIIGGVLALIGLIVNAAVDLDNVYDMTTTALWLLTVVVVLAGAFLGGKKAGSPAPGASGTPSH